MDEINEAPPAIWEPANGIGLRHSPSIGKLAAALAKAQGEYEKALKDSKNPFYKSNYADLASIFSATRQALSSNGLALIQSPKWETGLVTVTTVLAHESGEWLADELKMPVDTQLTAQNVGKAITYGRRYAAGAFLAIAGEDDDGNLASGKEAEAERERHHDELAVRMDGQARIAFAQANAFLDACKKTGKTEAQIVQYLKDLNGYIQVEEMQKQHFNDAIKWALAKSTYSEATLQKSLDLAKDKPTRNWKAFWALAKKKNISEADVHQMADEIYHVKSLKDLSDENFADLSAWLDQQESA